MGVTTIVVPSSPAATADHNPRAVTTQISRYLRCSSRGAAARRAGPTGPPRSPQDHDRGGHPTDDRHILYEHQYPGARHRRGQQVLCGCVVHPVGDETAAGKPTHLCVDHPSASQPVHAGRCPPGWIPHLGSVLLTTRRVTAISCAGTATQKAYALRREPHWHQRPHAQYKTRNAVTR